jgi:hypothetical protein
VIGGVYVAEGRESHRYIGVIDGVEGEGACTDSMIHHSRLMRTRASKSAAREGGDLLWSGVGVVAEYARARGVVHSTRIYTISTGNVSKVFLSKVLAKAYRSDTKVVQKCYQSVILLSGQLLC